MGPALTRSGRNPWPCRKFHAVIRRLEFGILWPHPWPRYREVSDEQSPDRPPAGRPETESGRLRRGMVCCRTLACGFFAPAKFPTWSSGVSKTRILCVWPLTRSGAITLKEAREKARAWIELGLQGKHPLEEEKARRAAERAKQGVPFRTVAEDFIARQVVGQRRGANDGREIRN